MSSSTESPAAEGRAAAVDGVVDAPSARPLRIVFSLLHSGYLRHYGEPIRLLAARGHSVHVSLYRTDAKDKGDDRLLARLLEDCPTVTAGASPRRRYLDGWRGVAWFTRALMDVLRYVDPRYASAVALRERTIEKVRLRVELSRVDPLSRALLERLFAWIGGDANPRTARRLIRLLGAVESAIPTSRRTDRELAAYGADLVLASPVVEVGSPQVEYLKSARRRGIPSAVCVASWDNLTNKGLLRVAPDRVLVWNEIQRRELEELHGIPGERVVLTGGQKFDAWFARRPSCSREDLQRRVGLDPDRPYLLYLCSSTFIAPDEVTFVRRWLDTLRRDGRPGLASLGVMIRPHPQNAEQWSRVDLGAYPNVALYPRDGEYPDEGEAQAAFYDSLAHAAAVVGINTSAQIEAGILGRPVYTVTDPEFAGTQEGTLHFHYLLRENGGFVRRAETLEEHAAQLAADLAELADGDRRTRAFVERFVRPRGLEAPVAPIVAREIELLGSLAGVRRRRPTPGAYALRLLLLPAVAATAIAGVPAALVHHLCRPGTSA